MPTTQDEVLKATEGLTGVTIPVHVAVEAKQVVLSQPEMRALLGAAEVIAIGDCLCRESARNCENPLEVCIALDGAATERIEECSWRRIAVEDALAVLEKTYGIGLVHLAYRRWGGEINLVCSCCSCCCEPLNALKRFSYHDGITESAFVARLDEAKCTGCGACVERCTFEAFRLDENADCVSFDSGRCFGCGLCVGTCPSSAITFVERS